MFSVRMRALVLFTAFLAETLSASTVFNFDHDPVQDMPLTITVSGVTATFTQVPEMGIDASGGIRAGSITSTGYDPNGAGQFAALGFRNGLDITFDQNLSSVSLDYQVFDAGGIGYFSLGALENGTLVGSVFLQTGTTENFYGEAGVIEFSGATFNEIGLGDVNHDFGIDNMEVIATPEPSTFGLILLSAIAVVSIVKKRQYAGTERD